MHHSSRSVKLRLGAGQRSLRHSVVRDRLSRITPGIFGDNRKVYAVGVRTADTALEAPTSTIVQKRFPGAIIPPRPTKPRARNFRRLPGFAVPGHAPVSVDRHDPLTQIRGLARRVARDLPQGDPIELGKFFDFVDDFVAKHVDPVDAPTVLDWIRDAPYPEARKEELRQEAERLRGQFPTLKECERIASFIKLESYPEYKEARWINSRADAFKVFSGRFFKAIEEQIYKWPWFIKHVPVPDRPALIAALFKAGLHFYENDYKAYESHFLRMIMQRVECALYRRALAKYPEEAEFIIKVLTGRNKLRTREGITLDIFARRMSGDMCTSLGNGFTNLMLILYIVTQKGGSVNGFVEGDDGLFATDVILEAGDFAKLGFTVEIKEVAHPTDAHFCGMTCTSQGEVLKDPRRVFQTFGWTHSCIHAGNAVMDQLLRAKSLSLAYELPQCPIVGVLARVALQVTEGVDRRDEEGTYRVTPLDFVGPKGLFCPTLEARQKMADLFQISIPTQLLAEDAIRRHDMVSLAQLIPANADQQHYAARYLEVG